MSRLLAPPLLLAALLPLALLFLPGDIGPQALPALGRSLLVAAAATALAVPLGTLAGLGLRGAFPGRRTVLAILALPVLLPAILPAAATRLAAAGIGEGAATPLLILWHAVLGAALVAAIIHHVLERALLRLPRAVLGCGIPPALAARRLLRPRLPSALALGGGLAFALSLGESSLSALSGVGTLPAAALAGGAAPWLLPVTVAVALAATLPRRGRES